jgi:hypothetical protein
MLAPGEMKKKWREAAGGGYTGSFASYADMFNKLLANEPVDETIAPEDVQPFNDKTRPEIKILGMTPLVAGSVLVGTLFVVGISIKLIFFNNKKKP